jgi:hypothetical protein
MSERAFESSTLAHDEVGWQALWDIGIVIKEIDKPSALEQFQLRVGTAMLHYWDPDRTAAEDEVALSALHELTTPEKYFFTAIESSRSQDILTVILPPHKPYPHTPILGMEETFGCIAHMTYGMRGPEIPGVGALWVQTNVFLEFPDKKSVFPVVNKNTSVLHLLTNPDAQIQRRVNRQQDIWRSRLSRLATAS